jgi:GxxExxY protein
MSELLYGDLCFQVVGAAMEVHRVLGPGFLEAVYESALAHELQLRNIPFRRQVGIEVTYKDLAIGEYRIDMLVDEKIVLEIKAVSTLTAAHEAQAHHYLAATGLRLALLLNFGSSSLRFRRMIR